LAKTAEQAKELKQEADYRGHSSRRHTVSDRPTYNRPYGPEDYDKTGSYDPTDAYILALDLEKELGDED
jgi:hypothetical protein